MKIKKIKNINEDSTLKDIISKIVNDRSFETWEELLAILKKEHEETFKDVNLEAQLDKFIDEQEEYEESENCLEEAREMADMFIAAAGIARFAPRFVEKFISPMLDKIIEESDDYSKCLVAQLALEKSLINKERKWNKNGGKYQHK